MNKTTVLIQNIDTKAWKLVDLPNGYEPLVEICNSVGCDKKQLKFFLENGNEIIDIFNYNYELSQKLGYGYSSGLNTIEHSISIGTHESSPIIEEFSSCVEEDFEIVFAVSSTIQISASDCESATAKFSSLKNEDILDAIKDSLNFGSSIDINDVFKVSEQD